jgi:hypothetical protein
MTICFPQIPNDRQQSHANFEITSLSRRKTSVDDLSDEAGETGTKPVEGWHFECVSFTVP